MQLPITELSQVSSLLGKTITITLALVKPQTLLKKMVLVRNNPPNVKHLLINLIKIRTWSSSLMRSHVRRRISIKQSPWITKTIKTLILTLWQTSMLMGKSNNAIRLNKSSISLGDIQIKLRTPILVTIRISSILKKSSLISKQLK